MNKPRTFTDGGLIDERAAMLRELESMHGQVIRIYDRLTELEIRSGAVGAAKTLGQKLRSAIDFISSNEWNPWDQVERLAANAWRIMQATLSEDGVLPSNAAWRELDDNQKNLWREAARAFHQ